MIEGTVVVLEPIARSSLRLIVGGVPGVVEVYSEGTPSGPPRIEPPAPFLGIYRGHRPNGSCVSLAAPMANSRSKHSKSLSGLDLRAREILIGSVARMCVCDGWNRESIRHRIVGDRRRAGRPPTEREDHDHVVSPKDREPCTGSTSPWRVMGCARWRPVAVTLLLRAGARVVESDEPLTIEHLPAADPTGRSRPSISSCSTTCSYRPHSIIVSETDR